MRLKQPRDCLFGLSGAAGPRAALRILLGVALMAALAGGLASAGLPRAAVHARAAGPAGRGLAGVALNDRGQALPGVEIRLVPIGVAASAAPILKVLSDEQGHFALGALAPGVYRLVAIRSGYSILIGQVDTLLHDTLELVLAPSGPPGPAGARPSDGSWALRLPHRDILEDRRAEPGDSFTEGGRTPSGVLEPAQSEFFAVEALTSRTAGGPDSPAGSGSAVALSAALFASKEGLLSGRLARSDEGAQTGLEERSNALQLHWVPFPEQGRLLDITADLFQRTSAVGGPGPADSPGRGRIDASGLHIAVSRTVDEPSRTTGLRMDVALASLDVNRPDAVGQDPASSAVRVSAGADLVQRWDAEREVRVEATVRGVRGTLDAAGAAPSLIVLPRDATGDSGSLGDVTGDGAEVAVTGRWRLDPALEVSARGRTTWTGGFDDGLRGSATVGARWAACGALVVRAGAGVTVGGASTGSGVAVLGLEGGGRDWSWSVSRERETGRGAFASEAAPIGRPDMLLVGPDAQTDRWVVGLGWQSSAGAPAVHVRAGRLSAEGGLAPRLPGDSAVVPLVANGSASGRQWELEFSAPRAGAAVLVTWEALRDASGAARLIAGAGQWERRAVSYRQRLGRLGVKGLNWELVMGAEEDWLAPSQTTADDPVRVALLERRRVSGGMSITF